MTRLEAWRGSRSPNKRMHAWRRALERSRGLKLAREPVQASESLFGRLRACGRANAHRGAAGGAWQLVLEDDAEGVRLPHA
eukprot:5523192-Pleurochrysis_carterae.AAC.3